MADALVGRMVTSPVRSLGSEVLAFADIGDHLVIQTADGITKIPKKVDAKRPSVVRTAQCKASGSPESCRDSTN